MLYDLGEKVIRYRNERKEKKRSKPAITRAEQQREFEKKSRSQQQRAREAMSVEDVRAMALEIKERAKKMILIERQEELRIRKIVEEEIQKEMDVLSEDGFSLRYESRLRLTKWRDSTELYRVTNIEVPVKHFILVHDRLSGTEFENESIVASCGDGTVRICENRSTFVCGRSADSSPATCTLNIPQGIFPSTQLLYGCGDGSIRTGWGPFHLLYRSSLLVGDDCPHNESSQWAEFELGCHHEDVVYGMLLSNQLLFSWSGDGTVKRWDLKTGDLMFTYAAHRGGVSKCIVSNDGKYLVTAGGASDPTIRLWDAKATATTLEPYYPLMCYECEAVARTAKYDNDEKKTLIHQEKLFETPIPIGRRKNMIQREIEQKREEEYAELLSNRERFRAELQSMKESFSGHHLGAISIFHDHKRPSSRSHSDWINGMSLNDTNTLLASCSSDKSASLWSFPSGELLHTFVSEDWVTCCALGKITIDNNIFDCLVTGGADAQIDIWDIGCRCKIKTLRGHSDAISNVMHHSNFIYSSSLDGTIRTWNMGSGPPRAPDVPLETDSSETSVTIKWSMPVQNGGTISCFIIQIKSTANFEECASVSIHRTNKAVTFKERIYGLHPGTLYTFRVAASNEFGIGDYSSPSLGRRCLPTMPARVDTPLIIDTTASGLLVVWIAPDSMGAHISHFVVKYRGGTRYRQFEDSPDLIVTWQDGKSLAEKEDAKLQAEIESITCWIRTNRRLPPKKVAPKRTRLLLLEQMHQKRSALSRDGGKIEMNCIVQHLEPGMAFQVSIAAVNKIGIGSFSPPCCSEETKPSAPSKMDAPQVCGVGMEHIKMQWQSPNDNGSIIQGFTMRYSKWHLMDEYICCMNLEQHASEAISTFLSDDTFIHEQIAGIVKAKEDITKESIVGLKNHRRLNEKEFQVLQAVYIALYLNHEVKQHTPTREDFDRLTRHVDVFLNRLEDFHAGIAQVAKLKCHAVKPLPLDFVKLIFEISNDEIKLDVCKCLKTWLDRIVDYDQQSYIPKIYPAAKTMFVNQSRRCEIESQMKTLHTEQYTATIENLESGEAYCFQIGAHNACGSSRFSDISQPQIVKKGPPTSPQHVELCNSTTHSMDIVWNPPVNIHGSPLTGYRIQHKILNGTYHPLTTVPGDQHQFTMKDLEPQTVYKIRIFSVNDFGESDGVQSDSFATLPRRAPDRCVPEVLDVSADSFQLKWQLPLYDGGAPILKFHVNVDEGKPLVVHFEGSVGPIYATVSDGIKPDTEYVCTITAENSIGMSPPSKGIKVKTK